MEPFYLRLTENIVEAVTADLGKILQEIGEEQIYAAALVTDSDCITPWNTWKKTETRRGRKNGSPMSGGTPTAPAALWKRSAACSMNTTRL